ncbi:hypothetical protein [Dubosiella newyorkensis]|uniref:hypothetical protein n=1 Tax=Dubosiella newyorkensis TaxID=1862672 RepID=UPI00272E2868|nr:hypothetical protein [Dubosiella newyorkensis]
MTSASDGLADLERYIETLQDWADEDLDGEMKQAIYAGAEIMTNTIRAEIQSHPTHTSPVNGMTKQEQKGLLLGLGISSFDKKDGDYNVKTGFDGYDSSHKTRKYPEGVPIPLTARSLRKGTSWRVKDDFISRAVSKGKKKTIEVMSKSFDESIKKRFEKI